MGLFAFFANCNPLTVIIPCGKMRWEGEGEGGRGRVGEEGERGGREEESEKRE